MNEEQIKELVSQLLNDFKDELLTAVDEKNSGLASNLTKKLKSIEANVSEKTQQQVEEEQSNLATKSLEQRIQELEQDLRDKEHKAYLADRDAKIADLMSNSKNIQSHSILSRQLKALYGDSLIKENGTWYIKEGEDNVKEFDAVYNEYLKSDEGSFFVKPSSTVGGDSKTIGATVGKQPTSQDELVLSAFQDF